ncbi:hypothetical protein OE88DRAFT_1656684, partial [Heliocybe sulcata]
MASHVRQSSLRVRGHIRPSYGNPRMHSPEGPTATMSVPSTSTPISTTPQSPSLTEFRTSYFFDGPTADRELSSPSSVTGDVAPPSRALRNPQELTRTLFEGPSRPRYIIPLAQLYLGEIKSAKAKSASRAAESSNPEGSNLILGKV